MSSSSNESNWMSISDMMTGLMVVFMFIAIAYILEVLKKQDTITNIVSDYAGKKIELYKELDSTFNKDFKKWQVDLNRDLSIEFTNPEVLFQSGRIKIRKRFLNILNTFLPKYFDILLQKKYIDNIAEVRIEGHTDDVPAPYYDNNPYIGNTILSQLRATEVLKYLRNMQYFKNLNKSSKERIQYWLTANGLSYGRTLDNEKQLTYKSGKKINKAYSRRVEFKIITTSDEILNYIEKMINEQ